MSDTADLKKTPLHSLHISLGARMVPFAGYDMPVQYAAGVLKEHLQTRASAGLFDVSHMGQVIVRAKSGRNEDAALALESIVPVDVLGLKEGRQRYALFTNDEGGILDDLMIVNRGDHFYVVVNAACKHADLAYMQEKLGDTCEVTPQFERGLLALQGPKSEAALARLAPEVAEMKFMDARALTLLGAECVVSRTGYSGEDGFEISVPAEKTVELAEALLAMEEVQPIGLGARDSLRLEAGLCLYGNDIDTGTTPVEAGLEWAMQKVRRKDGARAGGFPGAEVILAQLEGGAARRRVGLKPEGKAPVRGHSKLYADAQGKTEIGEVTSGGFGPSAEGPIAMGYVPTAYAAPGTGLFAEVRGKYLPVSVAALPFVTPTYKR